MMNKLFLSTVLLFALHACTKKEYLTYTEKNGLVFRSGENLTTADSISFSFITEAVQGDKDTVWVPIALTGRPGTSDMPFTLEVAETSTAEEGRHFRLTETVFPAGITILRYPVVLLRAEELTTERRSFTLRVKENDHFAVGAVSASGTTWGATNTFRTFSSIRIAVTDQVIRPSWWGAAQNHYYGPYSHRKYRFMIEVIGISNFSSAMLSYPQIMNYKAALSAAIIEYEKEHGEPLRDENGQIVTFP